MKESASAYVPIDRRWAIAQGLELPQQTKGAALFADVSGFTQLTVALLKELGLKRGPEELTSQLNRVWDTLIRQVHNYGGTVIGFSGDGITCWFDDNLAAPAGPNPAPSRLPPSEYTTQVRARAVACGLAMQQAMRPFSAVKTPAGIIVSLGMKIAVAAGPVRRFLVGDPDIQYIDVLAGTTLDRMAAAEHLAERGELIVAPEIVTELSNLLEIVEFRIDQATDQSFAVVNALKQEIPPTPWPVEEPVLAETQSRSWLLPPVYEQLKGRQGQFLAEIRPAVALFMRFGGIDYDTDELAGQKLDAYIRWVQRIIARYEGFLIQLTLGDKGSYLYITFGAPLAHEDDPARAVATAIALQSPPAALNFVGPVQIGISQGRMRAGAYGGRSRRTYAVLGDPEVVMAARFMTLARPGQILVSQRVAKAVASGYRLKDMGLVEVKGRTRSIPVSLVLGRKDASARRPVNLFSKPLVGREEELNQMLQLLDLAATGRGQLLRIEGVAGIGKSHLLSEFARHGLQHTWRVVLGSCQSTSQDTPYYVWQQIFRALFVLTDNLLAEEDDEQTAISQIEQVEMILTQLNPDWLIRLPLLGDLLNLPIPDNATTAAFDPKLRQESLFSLAIELLGIWAGAQPLLVTIEDAQWMDESSRGLTLALARVAAAMPVIIAIAHRPPLDTQQLLPELSQQPGYQALNLSELSTAGVAAIVANRLQGKPSALLVDLIQVQARGNPFFCEELVDTLLELGHLIQQEDRTWVVAEPIVAALRDAHCLAHNAHRQLVLNPNVPLTAANLGLPDSIQGLVLARIDRLQEAHRLTLKVASVIGRLFEFRLLSKAHPVETDEAALLEHALVIEERDFTRMERPLPNLAFIFKHNITRDVAYDTLLGNQQRELHRAVAEALEALLPDAVEQLAYHYTRARVWQKAKLYLSKAARKAQQEYMNETALSYYNQALSIEERWRWRKGQIEVLHILGRRDEERASLERLAANPDAPPFEIAFLLGQYYEAMSDYLQAQAAISWALEASRADGDLLAEMRSLIQFGIIASRQGEYDQAKIWYNQALALLQPGQTYTNAEAQAMVRALNGLGVVLREQGEFDQARACHEQALTLCRQIGDRRGEARAFNDLGATASYQRDFSQALACYRQALEIRQAIGNRAGEGATLNNLAQITRDAGDYGQALDYLSAALSIMQVVGNRWGEVNVWNDLGIMYQELGDFDQAQLCLERGQQIAREIDDEVGQAYLLDNLGLVAYDRGDLATAEALFNEGRALAEAHDDRRLVSNLINHLSMVSLSAGKLDQALDQAATSLAMRREMNLHLATIDDLATLAATHLAMGDITQALDYAQQTLDFLAYCDGEGPEFPQRGYFIGYQVLQAAGHPEAAQTALQLAYDFVMDRADHITDPNLRQSFLTKVPLNREIVTTFETD